MKCDTIFLPCPSIPFPKHIFMWYKVAHSIFFFEGEKIQVPFSNPHVRTVRSTCNLDSYLTKTNERAKSTVVRLEQARDGNSLD